MTGDAFRMTNRRYQARRKPGPRISIMAMNLTAISMGGDAELVYALVQSDSSRKIACPCFSVMSPRHTCRHTLDSNSSFSLVLHFPATGCGHRLRASLGWPPTHRGSGSGSLLHLCQGTSTDLKRREARAASHCCAAAERVKLVTGAAPNAPKKTSVFGNLELDQHAFVNLERQ